MRQIHTYSLLLFLICGRSPGGRREAADSANPGPRYATPQIGPLPDNHLLIMQDDGINSGVIVISFECLHQFGEKLQIRMVSEMRRVVLLSVLLCFLAMATASSKEGTDLKPPDWLSSGVGQITYYGPFGYPMGVISYDQWYPLSRPFIEGTTFIYPISVRYYDDRLLHDEWYPVARSFLDGPSYPPYYYTSLQTAYIDGSWWRDPRGYRPLYKIGPGYQLSSAR